jgi:hypothetical protein
MAAGSRAGHARRRACRRHGFALIVAAMLGGSAIARASFRRSMPLLPLFALLLQFVVGFGHVHPEGYRFLLTGRGAAAVHTDGGSSDDPLPAVPSDGICPICASGFLLAHAPTPAAVALPAPPSVALPLAGSAETLRLGASRRLLFVARAPPTV